jgi:hypothetical protein
MLPRTCSASFFEWRRAAGAKEMTGHYVNYRKQTSPRGRLLPEEQFRLIAVWARRPRELFAAVRPEPLRSVYICRRGTDTIRLVVAAELLQQERNVLLHLSSVAPEQVQYGVEHYRVHAADTNTIVKQLFVQYRAEGLTMPFTLEDFKRELAREHLHELTAEERLATPRHKTAIRRGDLSRPMKCAPQDGLIGTAISVFDYGWGMEVA